MDLKHELLIVQELFVFRVNINILVKLFNHKGLATARVSPEIDAVDVI